MNMLVIFITLTILNVVIQTVKSIATIKCGKSVASLVNAVAYGLYTYVIFFTSADGIDIHTKALITALANLVGVYVVKFCEEKARKDKLWKVEATFKNTPQLLEDWKKWKAETGIDTKYHDIGKHLEIDFYSNTQAESVAICKFIKAHGGKYFASESKSLD